MSFWLTVRRMGTMGNRRKCNKFAQRKRDLKQQGENLVRNQDKRHYEEIVRENKAFETYYKAQNICPHDEWDLFMKTMKENLPTAFRITGSRGEANALLEIVQGKYFKDILNSKLTNENEILCDNSVDDEKNKTSENNESIKTPTCLSWYPGGLAWQLQLTRIDIRRNETYYRLHNFLTAETNSGNISRQEAVSMIPPIVLGVKSHHKVLDMCASPGSKTAQLIEFLHGDDSDKMPSGFVMANDVDNNRCYMLVHQAKRLNSPCILITNHDAAFMPNLIIGDKWSKSGENTHKKTNILKFDKILCDVPCTGDGTLRKNSDIWLKWSPANGNNMHGIQFRIARRGAEMLAIGGQLAYSTCSLNPLENESVILRLLRESKGALKLVDMTAMLPGLNFSKGMTYWRPGSKDLDFYDTFEDVPEKWRTVIRPQMFPPTTQEIEEFCLDRCIRILPHHQDTGGFFIALLEKVDLLPYEKAEKIVIKEQSTETGPSSDQNVAIENGKNNAKISESTPSSPCKKRRRLDGYKEDPYVFFTENEEVYTSIKEFYGLDTSFDPKCLLTRCRVGKKKNIYLVSPIVKDIIIQNEHKIKIINTGVKTFVRCDNKNMSCPFRLSQEGLSSILFYVTLNRKVCLPKQDLVMLLFNDNPSAPPDINLLTSETQERIKDLSCGSCILLYQENGLSLQLVGWRGVRSLRAYTALPDTIHMLRLLGEDTSKFDVNKFKKNDDHGENKDKLNCNIEKETE